VAKGEQAMTGNGQPQPKPSIDERLEAIVQTLGLVANMQLKTEKEIKRLGRYVRIIVRDHEERLAALEDDDDQEQPPNK
jgi:hypothetical protein